MTIIAYASSTHRLHLATPPHLFLSPRFALTTLGRGPSLAITHHAMAGKGKTDRQPNNIAQLIQFDHDFFRFASPSVREQFDTRPHTPDV